MLLQNQTITLPQLPSLPKSYIWIFLSKQLCVHLSHSAHHHHSHFAFQKKTFLLHSSSVNFFQKFHENPPTPFRPSPTHPSPFLPSSHQFSSIPLHYSQPPSSLNHTTHTTKDIPPHAIPCNSNGDAVATRWLINQT
jgi:hypothetical protein